MSFFAKASVEALRRFPAVNAEIREESAIYRNYQDIGIAIGGGKGLVVPILRNTERMSFAEIEWTIADFAKQAAENRLQAEDLIGGTFLGGASQPGDAERMRSRCAGSDRYSGRRVRGRGGAKGRSGQSHVQRRSHSF